ncbi:hypothetical protein [Leisingera sp. ANG59]|uniref:hypothetical protein n=1 Tax=Leisingera sp. ANG59 TaxID=2675221 RepID=UPI001573313E|nr:hypothetical protein [Leisingera sp. ANG59]NSY39433.1 hypothetical protein [Leisingera sp. ANG59]
MFAPVSSTAGFYTTMQRIQAPASSPADRASADASLVSSMTPARDALPAGSAADALTSQYIGPAREAARAESLEPRPANGIDMDAFYQDLMNGCQAGPKPVSALAAEAKYAKVQRILS